MSLRCKNSFLLWSSFLSVLHVSQCWMFVHFLCCACYLPSVLLLSWLNSTDSCWKTLWPDSQYFKHCPFHGVHQDPNWIQWCHPDLVTMIPSITLITLHVCTLNAPSFSPCSQRPHPGFLNHELNHSSFLMQMDLPDVFSRTQKRNSTMQCMLGTYQLRAPFSSPTGHCIWQESQDQHANAEPECRMGDACTKCACTSAAKYILLSSKWATQFSF